jgi:hypothetical protein
MQACVAQFSPAQESPRPLSTGQISMKPICRGIADENPDGPSGVDLTGASLRNSDLRGANLSHAKGLIPSAIAGADLTDAKLPDAVTKFDALAQVAETSKNGSIAFDARGLRLFLVDHLIDH